MTSSSHIAREVSTSIRRTAFEGGSSGTNPIVIVV